MSFTHFSLISWATTVDTIVPFFFAHLILASALGLTKPASGSRPYIVVLILACCLVSVRSSASRRVPGEIGGEYVIGFVFHASHFLCLVKLSPPEGLNWRDRYSWAVNQLFEARWGISPQILPAWGNNRRNGSLLSETHQPGTGLQQISMKGETDNPSPQAAREIDDDNVPSKRAFILARLWDLSWTVLALWFFGHFKLLIFPDDITSVPDGFLHRLGNISGREMAIRVYMTFLGLVTPYCTLRAAHSLASVLTVALGDLPKRWPPLFGSIGDAYTVRRFYA
ncbi:hypothetical protein MMC19_007493 [Ptychographa xylographoides]|nr:hypothetical protein [Ptychographa xylographoides]